MHVQVKLMESNSKTQVNHLSECHDLICLYFILQLNVNRKIYLISPKKQLLILTYGGGHKEEESHSLQDNLVNTVGKRDNHPVNLHSPVT